MTQLSNLNQASLACGLLLLLSSLTITSVAQNNYGCSIYIQDQQEVSSVTAAASSAAHLSSYGEEFMGLQNLSGRDERVSTLNLPSKKSSSLLYLSDFGIELPDGVNIIGIEVAVTATVSVPDALRDVRVSLASGPNQTLGSDKANRSLNGNPWSNRNRWFYGSLMDDWNAALNASTLTSSSFGLMLQVSNRSDEAVTAAIDQIAIRVYYQPELEICGHPCIPLHTTDENVTSISWNVSSGLRASQSQQFDNVLNVFADESPFGTYEICVSKRFQDGSSENCCRPLYYGSCEEGSIGDRIWEDLNGNGIQDNGEPNIDGCNVRLYDASFNLIGSTIAQNGSYSFTGLRKGGYVVEVDTKGFSTTIFTDSNSTNNSDITNLYVPGSTSIIELGEGENRTDIDLGLVQLGSICGHAFRDRNADGLENLGDTSLLVQVQLYDNDCNFITTTFTDTNGDYCFPNLAAGDYFIDFILDDCYAVSTYGAVNLLDTTTEKVPVSVTYGETSLGNDVGVYKLSSIGDRAWRDENGNGIQDPGELGLEGVMLNLFTCDNLFVASTTTDLAGNYSFEGVSPGSYYVCVESAPRGYLPTILVMDENNSILQDNGCSICIDVLDETNVIDADLGFVFGSSDIGDRIWFDENENGIQDTGEIGLSDVRLTLQDCNGLSIATDITDANGNYLFPDVLAGDYVICIEENYREFRIASSLIVNGNCTDCFRHEGQDTDLSLDFELIYEKAVVDTKIFIDDNGNGLREDSETPVEGIRTELFTCDGELVGTDFTDPIGGSWFPNLCAGEYFIRVTIGDEFEFITNGGPQNLSDPSKVATSDCFTVLGFGRTIDVGLNVVDPRQGDFELCATVWNDENENEVIDLGENNISGLGIDVFTCQGLFVTTIQTVNGDILCADLEEGEYYLSVPTPLGFEIANDSEITGINGPGTTECFFIDENTTVNLGFVELSGPPGPGTIGLDAVLFEDLNGNGLKEPNEPAFSGIGVNLRDCDRNLIASIDSDNDGAVWFGTVPVGGYIIEVAPIPGFDFNPNGEITNGNGIGTTDCFQLGPLGRTIFAPYQRLAQPLMAAISGTVWFDQNGDGFLNNSERRMEEVKVRLYDQDFMILDTSFTDQSGLYRFTQLAPGGYFVQFGNPGGYSYSPFGSGGNSDLDSEVANMALGMTELIEFTATRDMDNVNAGLTILDNETAIISGRVWLDDNSNNILDVNEIGYSDLVISLHEDNGFFLDLTFTDENGNYSFENLPAGNYYIDFEHPLGFQFSEFGIGNDNSIDSDVVDFQNGLTEVYELSPGHVLEDISLGLQTKPTAELGGIVWLDNDEDGLIGMNESGVGNILVTLMDYNNQIIGSTITNAEGSYIFQDLIEGSYTVQFEIADFKFSPAQVGGLSDIDSEVTDFSDGTTNLIFLSGGESNVNINAGLQEEQPQVASVSGLVWLDEDKDGLVSTSEAGVENIEVTLFDENDNRVDFTFTNSEGRYTFLDVPVGAYYVGFQVGDFLFTTPSAGGNSTNDSEVVDLTTGSTAIINVVGGNNIIGMNAGIFEEEPQPGAIGGKVWLDEDKDGRIGVAEIGLEQLVVFLFDEQDNLVQSTTTMNDGRYTFIDLPIGNYYVQFENNDLLFTSAKAGGNSILDSEVTDLDGGTTDLISLDSGVFIFGINAGLIEPEPELGAIGGTVWLDTDEDGKISIGENNVSQIVVSLFDDNNILQQSTITNDEGRYIFADLVSGSYYVEFQVEEFLFTAAKTGGISILDSEVTDLTAGTTSIIELAAGEFVFGINAGLLEAQEVLGIITGTVWLDNDEDGRFTINESGVDLIAVSLFDNNDNLVNTTVTNAEGKYTFEDVSSGTYYVQFAVGNHTFTSAKAGGNSILDSEVIDFDAGTTDLIEVAAGEFVFGINAGLIRLQTNPFSSISGTVWGDENQNGFFEVTELPVGGVEVVLFDQGGTELDRVLTTRLGGYLFDNLNPDFYELQFIISDEFSFTTPLSGGTATNDSEVTDLDSGKTRIYDLSAGIDLENINAGIFTKNTGEENGQVSGVVWLDEDQDGLFGATEAGIPAITVSLYTEADVLVESTMTDTNGTYSFGALSPGSYYVSFENPIDHILTVAKAGGISDLDSEVINLASLSTGVFEILPDTDLTGINAGFYLPTSLGPADLGGVVWEDINGDGLITDGEPFQEGINVNLLDAQGNILRNTETDDSGNYVFTDLNPASYLLEFDLPLDTKATFQNSGTNPSIDSDVNVAGFTEPITLTDVDITGVNAGYYFPVSIGDFVWLDINEDGIQDAEELGANNYILSLFTSSGDFIQRAFTTFDVQGQPGFYRFADLAPGTYYVSVILQQGVTFSPTEATDTASDSDITNANGLGSTSNLVLVSGEQKDDIDIGLILAPSTLGDRLWVDANGDGIQDDDEEGLDGITVELYNIQDELVASTTTATIGGQSGSYLFEDIYPTDYYVRFDLPQGYVTTQPDKGGVDSMDSDVNNSNGEGSTSIFLLSPGEVDLDVDGGIFLSASIGDKVWHDRNLDGFQDSNEPGVENVEVELYQVTDEGTRLIDATLTDNLGNYIFENLPNGDYFLIFYPPDDFEMTDPVVGDSDRNSDASKTGVTDIVSIVNSLSHTDIDAGLIRPSNQIRGFAWNDTNRDGLYDTNESFLEGVTVWLLNDDDQLVLEGATDIAGVYLFDNIPDGDYYVKAIPPADFEHTIQNFGPDDTIDSDLDAEGDSEIFSFSGSTVIRNVDAGFFTNAGRPSSIFPNPISGPTMRLSTVIYQDGLSVDYLIMDRSGQVISRRKLDSNAQQGSAVYDIPVQDIDAGNYLFRLAVGNAVESLQFTKITGN